MLYKKYFSIKNNKTFDFNKVNNQNNIFFMNKINETLYIKLNKYKELINKIEIKNWNKTKILTYNYEYVYNMKYENSLVKYKPISRAYYKLCEIMLDKVRLKNTKMKFCFLAECPGGFIDYIINSRKHLFCKDEYYTISLISHNKNVPNFYLLNQKYNNINIINGVDKKGDLCNVENIKYLNTNLKVDFVTADGGFDFTENYEEQENNISFLIFCEIISAFSILNEKGTFILKVFDLYSLNSFNYIYLLSLYFNNIEISKPHISKPANSEKYILCNGFKGINQKELEYFFDLIKNKKKIQYKLPIKYIEYITQINTYYTILQINNILHTIVLYQINIHFLYKKFILFKIFVYSILWCLKYNQSINFKTIFFNNYYKQKINNLIFK
tara:strand:- start:270 stop:1424 length:1155 start_codon:yes stop_codon:yes gene_type:complete